MTSVETATPLRQYAAIGDGRTIALVSERGSIDWLPLPNLDSAPVFAKLLDDEEGGSIDLAPDAAYELGRRYVPRTNVLETTYTTEQGVARVTEALTTGIAGRLPWAELARRVTGISGTVRFTWRVRPGSRLGTAAPWAEQHDGVCIFRIGTTSIAVLGEGHGEPTLEQSPTGPVLHGSFEVGADDTVILGMTATDGEPLPLPSPGEIDSRLDQSVASWRAWSKAFAYEGPWAREVQRSALALKLLVYSPTGAIAAAATTSLPENPRGGKNWDYRFAWVRDLAYTAHAMVRFGLNEEPHAALSWLLKTIRAQGPDLHVMYSLRGELVEGVERYDVPGWAGIGPVVSGNPAHGQLQLGVYGDLFAICRMHADAGNVLDIATGRLLADLADRVCDLWRSADSGMWELPETHHYTSSKMGCWQALRDAVHLTEQGAMPGDIERWSTERDRIEAWVGEHCWSPELQSYVMYPGTLDLDASVLLHAESGFDRGERMSSTIDALTQQLGAGSLLYRYTGMDQEEHTFVATAFWRASALACVGRHDEALEAMDDLVARANDVGLYAEMISEHDDAFWGNLPQALSHLALINAAMTIRELVPEEALDGR